MEVDISFNFMRPTSCALKADGDICDPVAMGRLMENYHHENGAKKG